MATASDRTQALVLYLFSDIWNTTKIDELTEAEIYDIYWYFMLILIRFSWVYVYNTGLIQSANQEYGGRLYNEI